MYKNIAIAYDGSEGSRLALEKGIELSKILPESKLTVIYVNEEAQERTGYMDVGHASAPVTSANVDSSYAQFMPQGIGDDGYRPPQEVDTARASEYSKHMHNSIQQQLDAKNAEASVLALEGPVIKTITGFVDEQNIDLLIVGNSGKSGLQKFFVGSVSSKLIKDSNSTVLVVK
ncbi:universal stress protein [Planococcus citreus]|uniref:Nucleotide-binding universal stress UspA family protein n=1 Tax=Planococcus citreus TaxID=1373 RepID=A0A497YFB0_9BACL|nr:universal stress protein [Planococcus citreus]RLJ85235.1 nucleotide-binding universal stress UspA family protein [Planococcus citreus]